MSENINLAIVGHGFVGKAVDYGFTSHSCNKYIIDPLIGTTIEDLKDKSIDVSFVCVPTPMGCDGKIDATILMDAVDQLSRFTNGLIVIKSTITPDIVKQIVNESDRVIYNPEFLTERSSNDDFVNPFMHVFGGEYQLTRELEAFYKKHSICKPCVCYHMSALEASFVKYGVNNFLMTKVLFFNQLFDLIEKESASYSSVINAIGTDPRIGLSHTTVPGHDGRKGSGGPCFSKDSFAFLMYAREIGKPFTILEEAVRRNQEYRIAYGEPLQREKEQNIKFDYEV